MFFTGGLFKSHVREPNHVGSLCLLLTRLTTKDKETNWPPGSVVLVPRQRAISLGVIPRLTHHGSERGNKHPPHGAPSPHHREENTSSRNHAQGRTLPLSRKHKVRSTFGWFSGPAFRTTYRTWLRSSSPRVPRHPLGGVVSLLAPFIRKVSTSSSSMTEFHKGIRKTLPQCLSCEMEGNDPSAGSPTKTLLRLQLPLEEKVWGTSLSPAPKNGRQIQTPHLLFHR